MYSLKAAQIYVGCPIGPRKYIFAVFIYNIHFGWLKESSRTVFMIVFSIAMLCPVHDEFSLVMKPLLEESLSKKRRLEMNIRLIGRTIKYTRPKRDRSHALV